MVREMRYDPIGKISSLVTVECSKVSLIQRAGRAGLISF